MLTFLKNPARGVLALCLLTGCAGVTRQDMLRETEDFDLPGAREPGKASVYIVRPSAVGALIRFNVFVGKLDVDTLEAGFTRGNQYLHFNVGPGHKTLYSVAENTASMSLGFHPDSTYFIRQDAQMGFVMARNALVLVDSVEGKYYVKKTSLGTIMRPSFP
jgi:hypothetical protein